MNRELAKKYAPIIQAMADGKTIQYRAYEIHRWQDVHESEEIDLCDGEYRIKPEPREAWVSIEGGIFRIDSSREGANKFADDLGLDRASFKLFREVIE